MGVFVQFHLDMGDNVVSDAGLFLAGGNYFGGPWEGRYPFTQPDSAVNMWMLADSFPANLSDAYTYLILLLRVLLFLYSALCMRSINLH